MPVVRTDADGRTYEWARFGDSFVRRRDASEEWEVADPDGSTIEALDNEVARREVREQYRRGEDPFGDVTADSQ